MDFFINLGETTLKTRYCRENRSIKIFLRTRISRGRMTMLEIFGVPRDCRQNLHLIDYEITTMDDHYIAIKPYSPGERRGYEKRLNLVILPTSPLDEKPYQDPKMNRYDYYIRRCTVNGLFLLNCYPIKKRVYEKQVRIYDLIFDSYLGRKDFLSQFQSRTLRGTKLLPWL